MRENIDGPLPGGQGTQGPYGHQVLCGAPAHVLEGHGQRALFVQQVVGHHEGEGGRHPEVRQEADGQRHHDADGDGLLGVPHLLPCSHTHTVWMIHTHTCTQVCIFTEILIQIYAHLHTQTQILIQIKKHTDTHTKQIKCFI